MQRHLFLLGKNGLSVKITKRHATDKGLGFCGCLFVATEKRWIVFLFLSTVFFRKMPQLSTLEATSTGEKAANVGQLWSITAFVRSMGWLISPASVEAITLQLNRTCL